MFISVILDVATVIIGDNIVVASGAKVTKSFGDNVVSVTML